MTDLLPRPSAAVAADEQATDTSLDTDYLYAGTFLASTGGMTTNPRSADITLKLTIPGRFRAAADLIDRLPMLMFRVDVWCPRDAVEGEDGEDGEVAEDEEGDDGDE